MNADTDGLGSHVEAFPDEEPVPRVQEPETALTALPSAASPPAEYPALDTQQFDTISDEIDVDVTLMRQNALLSSPNTVSLLVEVPDDGFANVAH